MSRLFMLCSVLLSLTSLDFAHAAIYKCTSLEAKLSYQAHPCDGDEEEVEIEANKDSDDESASGSINGNWLDVSGNGGRMEIYSSGTVAFTSPDGDTMTGTWTEKSEGNYHVDLSLDGFDLSSDLTLNQDRDQLTLQMGRSVSSTFRRAP